MNKKTSIVLSKYSNVINDKTVGANIYLEIKTALESFNIIEIDLENIKAMTTFCARQIFGQLYIELGSEIFFNRIEFIKGSDNLKIIIQWGIEKAIRDRDSELTDKK
jgi:hypothetical protein